LAFNSYVFWSFFLVVIGLYRLLPHRSQNRMLLVASYLFYGAWDARFLLLIALSTVVDFLVAQRITAASEKKIAKRWCTLSIAVNLGLLGVFKYYDFFVESFAGLLSSLFGYEATLLSLGIVLPVGISFYTFQTLSYTIDVYRGHTKPARDLLDFALYVSFFPQLVAGPIERSHRLLPQIVEPRKNREGDFAAGLYLVIAGLFAKVVIADNMAFVCNGIFAAPADQIGGLDRLVGIYAFAFQIYGDFYGYSSIARGISRWMGIDLMANFHMPYFARSPSDFWSRWHISLSSWLRDYLYIPLGGNRGSRLFTYRNLMLTMLLGGLWHGAGWTFVLWGLYQGLLLCAYRPFESRIRLSKPSIIRRLIGTFVFFNLVCLGWLFFRAESIAQVGIFLREIFTNFHPTVLTAYGLKMLLFFAGPFLLFEIWLSRCNELLALTKVRWGWRAAAYTYAVYMLLIYQPLRSSEFIYFQF
jgi:alginate O-acetyltransferase complex protein AlgI